MSVWTPSLPALLMPGRSGEHDPAVRSVIADVLRTSLRQCGAIGLVGTLLHVGLSALGLGYHVRWTYDTLASAEANQVVVLGTLIVAALSVMALVLAQMRCRLRTGRWFGAAAVLLTATVAMFEGGLRGTFGTVYVVPAFLVIVAIIPFRPPQVLAMSGMVALVVYAFGPTGPLWSGALTLSSPMAGHLAFVGGSAVLITGTSTALYQRHLSFGRAQAQLQKQRDLLRRVQGVAQVGGWEYDPEQDAVSGTEKLTELLSLSGDGKVGLDDGLDVYAPEAQDEVAAAIDRCLTDGEPFDLEVPLDTDGTGAPDDAAVRWARLRGQLRTFAGAGRRLTGTFQDITERKQREWALERERDRLQTLFENLPTPVVHCGIGEDAGTIKGVNRAFETTFGCDASEVTGADLCSFFDPADGDSMDPILDLDPNPPVQHVELTCDTVRGPREFLLHFAARDQADETVEGYAMFVDITEQKRRQEELERAKNEAEEMNRLKSTFLANMSHEIRTPLTSILGFSEAIEEAVTSPEETDVPIEEFSRRISKGGQRLLETLDSVLNLSELEAGAMDLRLQPVDLSAEAADTVDLFQQKAEAASVSLHTDLPDAPVYVQANPGALHRIERNLLSNAIKYTEAGDTVIVRVREADEGGVLEVEDTGIGMDPDEVDTLFLAFKQASSGTGRTHEGSGLGLAVVDRLVDHLDGTVEVETEPGAGTRFRVRLPHPAPSINGNGAEP